jgi:hypothetical protein
MGGYQNQSLSRRLDGAKELAMLLVSDERRIVNCRFDEAVVALSTVSVDGRQPHVTVAGIGGANLLVVCSCNPNLLIQTRALRPLAMNAEISVLREACKVNLVGFSPLTAGEARWRLMTRDLARPRALLPFSVMLFASMCAVYGTRSDLVGQGLDSVMQMLPTITGIVSGAFLAVFTLYSGLHRASVKDFESEGRAATSDPQSDIVLVSWVVLSLAMSVLGYLLFMMPSLAMELGGIHVRWGAFFHVVGQGMVALSVPALVPPVVDIVAFLMGRQAALDGAYTASRAQDMYLAARGPKVVSGPRKADDSAVAED